MIVLTQRVVDAFLSDATKKEVEIKSATDLDKESTGGRAQKTSWLSAPAANNISIGMETE